MRIASLACQQDSSRQTYEGTLRTFFTVFAVALTCGSRRRGRRRARLEAVGCERDVMHAYRNGPDHRL